MKHKLLKSLTSFVLATTLLVGCSTPQNTTSTEETNGTGEFTTQESIQESVQETIAEDIENRPTSYAMTQKTLKTSLDNISRYSIQAKKIFGLGNVRDTENKVIYYYLTSWEEDASGEWVENTPIELPFTSSKYSLQCGGLDMDADGNIYTLWTDSAKRQVYLLKIDSSGAIVLNCDIASSVSESLVVGDLFIGNDGRIYIENSFEQIVYVFDREGNYIGEYQLEEGYVWTLVNHENSVYLVSESKKQLHLSSLIAGDEILFESNGQSIPVDKYMSAYEGMNNDFWITTTSGLQSYTLGEETVQQILDWSFFGIEYTTLETAGIMTGKDEKPVITVIADIAWGFSNETMGIYTFVETDNLNQEYLTLATLGISSELKYQVTAYNKIHQECPIQIKTYTNDADGLRKMNTDLLAGKTIDIIDTDSLNHLTSLNYYAKQGLLEDIGAWLEKDDAIDENDLLQSILDVNKIDGVLYNLVPGFTIETFSGAESVVGDDFVMTMEEALNLVQNNTYSSMYAYQSKEQFITDVCRYNGAYLVSEEEGICRFNTEEFIDVLTYANTLPEEVDSSIYDKYLAYDQDSLLYKDTKLEVELQNYRAAKAILKEGVAKDNISLVGFPTLDETDTNGSAFKNLISVSLASTSKNKETAWGFFQFLLSDTYQKDERVQILGRSFLKDIGFPIRKSIIQSYFQNQLTNEEYANDDIRVGDDKRILYGYATEDDITFVNEFIDSIDSLVWENETLTNIVLEEAQYYFAGECTAEQAAQQMQSRVELYLMEKE